MESGVDTKRRAVTNPLNSIRENGAAGKNRTYDLALTKGALYP